MWVKLVQLVLSLVDHFLQWRKDEELRTAGRNEVKLEQADKIIEDQRHVIDAQSDPDVAEWVLRNRDRLRE